MTRDRELLSGEKRAFTSKALFSLIVPLMAESALNMLIGMADTMMVANCGESAVSAVSLVDSVSYLLITVFNAFATGGAVVCSQYIGAGESEMAKKTAKNLVYISLALGLLLLVVFLPIRSLLISTLFGTIGPDVHAYANDYFFYLAISYPFLALYTAFTALCRSESQTGRTFYTALVMNLINIMGNALLIFGLKMGPKGAAIATLISRIVGSLMLFLMLRRKREALSLNGIFHGPVDLHLVGRIARIGIPSGVEGSLFHVGKISVMSMISSLGTSAVAINAVVANFNSYSNIPGNAINLAIITVIGQLRGNKDYEGIRHYSKLLLLWVYITTAIVSIPLFIFAREVVSLYGLEAESLREAVPIARHCLISCLLIWPFAFSVPQMLKAVGDVRFLMISSMLSMWLVRVMGAYFFVKVLHMGVEGVWLAMYADWVIRGVLFTTRFMTGRWKRIRVIEG